MGLFVPKQAPWSGDGSFQLYSGFGPNYSCHVLHCCVLNWGEDSISKMGLLFFQKTFRLWLLMKSLKVEGGWVGRGDAH